MRHPLIAVLSAFLLLAGCSTSEERSAKILGTPTPLADHQRWWKPMHDPLIDMLADQMIAQNIDMKIAIARIAEARGVRRTATSGLFPQIGLEGGASRSNRENGQLDSIAQGGFDAKWEIDLFGHVRHGMNAADARVDAAEATAEDVRNSMLAELVRAVIDWRQAQETLRVTTTLLASQDDQISIVRSKTDAGLVDNSELERAMAQRQQTATQQPLAKAAAMAAQHQIERLLANEPGTLTEALASHAKDQIRYPSAEDVLGLDISNLRSRPDLRAKRAALLAADSDAAQAESDLWPKLTLGGFFGGQESSSGALIAGNPLWSIAAMASMPLLNFGRIRGAIDAADARAVQAELDYENASLTALQETHTALSDYLNGLNAVEQQHRSLEHRKTSVSLANERFTNGLSDMTDLTTAQSELDEATIMQINRQAAAAQAFVRLQKALGTAVSEGSQMIDTAPAAAEPAPVTVEAEPVIAPQPEPAIEPEPVVEAVPVVEEPVAEPVPVVEAMPEPAAVPVVEATPEPVAVPPVKMMLPEPEPEVEGLPPLEVDIKPQFDINAMDEEVPTANDDVIGIEH